MTINDIIKLNVPSHFGCSCNGEDTDAIEIIYDQLDDSVITKYGSSKFIILLDNNTVIKIPFNGVFEPFYNEEINEIDYDNLIFNPFYIYDYCALEASLYTDAVTAGIEIFFAKTTYGGMTNNGTTPYYISERVYDFYKFKNENKPSKNSWDKAKKTRSYLPVEWLAYAYEYYGEELVNKLLAFIEKNKINDLHGDNLGFRENGEAVILDYSGFDH